MAKTLVPSPQLKNLIGSLVESGTISGELATKWKEKANANKKKEDILKRARRGDVKAMELLGFNLTYGEDDFDKDSTEALQWFQKAHEAGSIFGTAHFGSLLAQGIGGEEEKMKGSMLLGLAAGKGSDYAAFDLGMILAEGQCGFAVDTDEAIRLLTLALDDSCSHKTLKEESKGKARDKMNELRSNNN